MSMDNPHACGACGYDGGVAHQKELNKLQVELHKMELAKADNDDTRQTKIIVRGFLGGVALAFLTMFSCHGLPDVVHGPPDVKQTVIQRSANPISDAFTSVESMYKECMKRSKGYTDPMKDCNAKFSNEVKELRTLLAKDKQEKLEKK